MFTIRTETTTSYAQITFELLEPGQYVQLEITGEITESFEYNNFCRFLKIAISSNSTEWFELYKRKDYWNSPFYVKNTEDLQTMASLFQVADAILNKKKTKEDDYLGKALFDEMPNRNFLLIPGKELQQHLNDEKNNVFFNLGLVYKCIIKTEELDMQFYYRPYNTTIVSPNVNINRELLRRLKSEYNRILSSDN